MRRSRTVSTVCPHAAIRVKVVDESAVKNAPEGFKYTPAKGFKLEGSDKPVFAISVSSYDCTGCGVCTQTCIGKDKTDETKKAINMVPQEPIKVQQGKCWDFFVDLPEFDRTKVNKNLVKQAMLLEPLFEFSGSCAGCGETAYVRLVSQLFGDRMVVANATGCSSIYGGNLPTTPWAKNKEGRGPAWANSLFEDNAEFGLGMRLAITKHAKQALSLLEAVNVPAELKEKLTTQDQSDEAGIKAQRENVAALKVLQEAEAHNGPSLIICYCPCINHGFDLNSQLQHQKMAVDSGYWTLLRYNPALAAEGKAPLILDSKKPTIPVAEYIYTENRYKQLTRSNPEVAKKLADDLQKEVDARYAFYDAMSKDTEGLISL